MTDAPIATKEHPAALDAFETAKPNEPIWTVQGGDPLGPPLLRIWAALARVRTGLSASIAHDACSKALKVACHHSLGDDEREVVNLLVRATATEEIAAAMAEYAKGGHQIADTPTEARDTHLSDLQRIDLHDMKVRAAQKLSSFRSELNEIREALVKRGYSDDEVLQRLGSMMDSLKVTRDAIEPRHQFKKDQ